MTDRTVSKEALDEGIRRVDQWLKDADAGDMDNWLVDHGLAALLRLQDAERELRDLRAEIQRRDTGCGARPESKPDARTAGE